MRIDVSEKEKFILRSACIFIKNGSVLLHRAEHEDIWVLPGGGCEFFEDSQTTLEREMQEELKASVEIKSLAFAVENFFEWEGQKTHEIGLYHFAQFTNESVAFYGQNEFLGIEDKIEGRSQIKLNFKWFKIEELPMLNVKPDFLKTKLKALSSGCDHIVNRD